MNKEKAILIAAALFATYPTVNSFFITSDGQAFENSENANAHARSLAKDEQNVTTVTREEATTTKTEKTEAEKLQEKIDKLTAKVGTGKDAKANEKIDKDLAAAKDELAALQAAGE